MGEVVVAITTWFVYIVRCADHTLYTGVTTDIERRVSEHNNASAGARYTRAKRPVVLVYHEVAADRSSACKREASIKKYSRARKLALVANQLPSENCIPLSPAQ